jgi:hypothetical protein
VLQPALPYLDSQIGPILENESLRLKAESLNNRR